MRTFRVMVLIIFVIVFVAFSFTFYRVRSGLDHTVPKLEIEEKEINVNTDVTEEQLMEGVTAYDAKDGDLTKKIIIQDISKFVSDSTSVVTYAVCDSDNHLVKGTRKIHYQGYETPRIGLNHPLVFPTSSTISLKSVLSAVDVIDGDISSNIVINSSNVDNTKDGIYSTSISVFNSKGDRVTYTLPIKVYTVTKTPNCEIKMKDYIVFTKLGEKITPSDYVEGVYNESGKKLNVQLNTEGYVNFNSAGTYCVYFSPAENTGYSQVSALTIIVEN